MTECLQQVNEVHEQVVLGTLEMDMWITSIVWWCVFTAEEAVCAEPADELLAVT
jgi:hypothetical protein